MNLLSYIDKDYTLIDFIKRVWDWQSYYDREVIEYLHNIPREYKKDYIKVGEIYRGMVVDLDLLIDLDICSWTTNITSAEYFTEKISEKELISKPKSKYHSVIFKKVGEYLDFSQIIKDLIEWIKDNEEYVLSEIDYPMEEILDGFYMEDEVLSDYKKDEVEIYFQEEFLVA